VLYIATVHFKSPKWIDIQSQFLHRHITEPFRTFAVLNEIPPSWNARFDTVIPAKGRHEAKLNLLAAEMSEVARPDDILLFVDGDAFPVADPMPTVYKALAESSLVAVRRNENWGDCQPHPSFCAIRVSEWQRLHGDWSPGRTWLSDTGHTVTDPGANLLAALERTGSTWTPLTRSNTWNPHPLWFGIYGDIVYHHGAGFRAPRARADRGSTEIFHRGEGVPVVAGAARLVNQLLKRRAVRRVIRESSKLSADWFARIRSDPEFFRPLIAPGGPPDDAVSRAGAMSSRPPTTGSE
jgi:hypothetical protein